MKKLTNQERLDLLDMLNTEIESRKKALCKEEALRGFDPASEANARWARLADAARRFAGKKAHPESLPLQIAELERTASEWTKRAGEGSMIEAKIMGRKIGMLAAIIHEFRSVAAIADGGEQKRLF